MVLNPPGTGSSAVTSRVTTPWRVSSCWVNAAAHAVGAARSRESTRPSSGPRPMAGPVAASGSARRAPRAAIGPGRRRRRAADAACRWSPAPARRASTSASTVSCGKPPPAASCSGAKNEAPLRRSQARMRVSRSSRLASTAGGASSRSWSVRYSAIRPSRSPSGSTPSHVTSPADDQRVELRRRVACDARRQDFALEHRGDQRRALQLLDASSSASRPARRPCQPVPGGEEAAEHVRLDRLHLLAQRGERTAADDAQHVGVAPLAALAARPELAFDDAAGRGQPAQRGLDHRARRGPGAPPPRRR